MTDSAEASTSQERDYPLLYRATDGNGDKSKKVKLSTIVSIAPVPSSLSHLNRLLLVPPLTLPPSPSQVHPTALPAFTTAYTALLRQSVTFLRPKKKKQLKKSSATTPSASASKPTAPAGTTFSRLPRLAGPKRGAGAHKRQRLKKRRAAQLGKMAARRRRDRP